MSDRPLKVSYCTTCKGRLHHLKETLPRNLAAEKDNPNVEFVVLDYDSNDGLGNWIKENFGDALASGRLRYVRHDDAPHFKMAHAKNMAHRSATGDILCNLDADSFLTPNYSQWLVERFTKNPHTFVTHIPIRWTDPWDHKFKRLTGRKREAPPGDLGGHIALNRDDYAKLGGYDERYSAWGYDDWNLALRAREAHLAIVNPDKSQWCGTIGHSDEERLMYLSEADREKSSKWIQNNHKVGRKNDKIHHKVINKVSDFLEVLSLVGERPLPHANLDGQVGCGTVRMNFSEAPTVIAPLTSGAGLEHEISGNEAYPLKTDWRAQYLANAGLESIEHPHLFTR